MQLSKLDLTVLLNAPICKSDENSVCKEDGSLNDKAPPQQIKAVLQWAQLTKFESHSNARIAYVVVLTRVTLGFICRDNVNTKFHRGTTRVAVQK